MLRRRKATVLLVKIRSCHAYANLQSIQNGRLNQRFVPRGQTLSGKLMSTPATSSSRSSRRRFGSQDNTHLVRQGVITQRHDFVGCHDSIQFH
jgi:hypothetical protein